MTKIVDKHMTDAHFEALRDALDADSGDRALVILILLRTGMRQEELIRLTRDSFDQHGSRIFVQAAKGSKSRWVPVDREFMAKLKPLIERIGHQTLGSIVSECLNPNYQKRAIQRAFHGFTRDVIGENRYTTHSLRHTFAIRCLKAFKLDLLKVQAIMGHKSINSTAQYLQYVQLEELSQDVLKAIG